MSDSYIKKESIRDELDPERKLREIIQKAYYENYRIAHEYSKMADNPNLDPGTSIHLRAMSIGRIEANNTLLKMLTEAKYKLF